MTLDDIKRRLANLDESRADIDTEALYRDVLRAIAQGALEPAALAEAALEGERDGD